MGISTCDDHPEGHLLGSTITRRPEAARPEAASPEAARPKGGARRRRTFFNDSVCREEISKALNALVLINYSGGNWPLPFEL